MRKYIFFQLYKFISLCAKFIGGAQILMQNIIHVQIKKVSMQTGKKSTQIYSQTTI